jgi:hypothetical protein
MDPTMNETLQAILAKLQDIASYVKDNNMDYVNDVMTDLHGYLTMDKPINIASLVIGMIGVPAALISAYKGIKECYGRFQ